MKYNYCVFYTFRSKRRIAFVNYGKAVVITNGMVEKFEQVVEMESEIRRRAPEHYTDICLTNYIQLGEHKTS